MHRRTTGTGGEPKGGTGLKKTRAMQTMLMLISIRSISCIAKKEGLARWPHLQDLGIPVLENGEVMLLISLKENPGLFVPLECKCGGHDQPIAI